jgi:hypothetical protein
MKCFIFASCSCFWKGTSYVLLVASSTYYYLVVVSGTHDDA